jgi:hypothetical protein
VNSKSGEHVSGVKPLGTPLLHRINQIIVKKRDSFCPSEIESHNHPEEKYYHSGGVVLDKRNNRTRRWKGDSKEGFVEMDKHRQVKVSQRWTNTHLESSDLSKSQNIGENDGEKKTLGGKGQHG